MELGQQYSSPFKPNDGKAIWVFGNLGRLVQSVRESAMAETLKDVESEINKLKKKIDDVENALQTSVVVDRGMLNALLVYNTQLAMLREVSNA